jgi:hypothetical protein
MKLRTLRLILELIRSHTGTEGVIFGRVDLVEVLREEELRKCDSNLLFANEVDEEMDPPSLGGSRGTSRYQG